MDKLTQEMITRRNEIVDQLHAGMEMIESAQDEVNRKIETLNNAIKIYNGSLDKADKFADEIVGEIEGYIANKSEGWQEENGDKYESWETEWSSINLQPVDDVSLVGMEDLDHATELSGLPQNPEG